LKADGFRPVTNHSMAISRGRYHVNKISRADAAPGVSAILLPVSTSPIFTGYSTRGHPLHTTLIVKMNTWTFSLIRDLVNSGEHLTVPTRSATLDLTDSSPNSHQSFRILHLNSL